MLHTDYGNIHKNEQKRYMIQTRCQARTSDTILMKVYCVDKGLNPNVHAEKQIIRPVVTSQSHVFTQSKD